MHLSLINTLVSSLVSDMLITAHTGLPTSCRVGKNSELVQLKDIATVPNYSLPFIVILDGCTHGMSCFCHILQLKQLSSILTSYLVHLVLV